MRGMFLREFMRTADESGRRDLAQKAGTSIGYLWLLAGWHRLPSPDLCRKLVLHEPRLTLPELRPDIWADPPWTPQPTKRADRKPKPGAVRGRRSIEKVAAR